ncbi:hypothetical protein KKE06_00900 [Candidatus Micrarchaeota archaeon]|nr:hypothetical protein [Candidatus Micrarchaeota archaeon]MBU1930767.1 hypothetical protein [Candidatus Micrarchaeota archaeon]
MDLLEGTGFEELARFRNVLNPSVWRIILVLARSDAPLTVHEIAIRTGLEQEKGLYEAERIINTLLHRVKDLDVVSKKKEKGKPVQYFLEKTIFYPGNKAGIFVPIEHASNVQNFDWVRMKNIDQIKILFKVMKVLYDGTKIIIQKNRDVINHEFVLDVGVLLKVLDYFDDLKPQIQAQLEIFKKLVEEEKTMHGPTKASWNSYFGTKPIYGTALLLSYVDKRAMKEESIQQGINFLLSSQRKDGSWVDKQTEKEIETEFEWEQIATVLFALAKHATSKESKNARKKAINLITNHCITDEKSPYFGMWHMKFKNHEHSYYNPTMRLIYELGRLNPHFVHENFPFALKYIEKGQQADGSWITEAMYRDQHFSRRKTDLIRGTVNGVLLLTEVERKPFDPQTIKAVNWLTKQFYEIKETSGPSSYSVAWLLYRLSMWLRISLNRGQFTEKIYT